MYMYESMFHAVGHGFSSKYLKFYIGLHLYKEISVYMDVFILYTTAFREKYCQTQVQHMYIISVIII